MSEKGAYIYMRDHVAQPRDRFDRIENVVVDGMPDVNYCIQGCEGWIEIKSPKKIPTRNSTPLFGSNHRLSQDQANWMLRQRKAGGRCFLLVKTACLIVLIDGSQADYINKLTINEMIEVSRWWSSIPVKKEKWSELRHVLCCQ